MVGIGGYFHRQLKEKANFKTPASRLRESLRLTKLIGVYKNFTPQQMAIQVNMVQGSLISVLTCFLYFIFLVGNLIIMLILSQSGGWIRNLMYYLSYVGVLTVFFYTARSISTLAQDLAGLSESWRQKEIVEMEKKLKRFSALDD